MLRRQWRLRFIGDQGEGRKIVIDAVIYGLAILKSILRGSCRPRHRDVWPGLPLQYVKGICTGDGQCEAGIVVSVTKLVGVRTTEWIYAL